MRGQNVMRVYVLNEFFAHFEKTEPNVCIYVALTVEISADM